MGVGQTPVGVGGNSWMVVEREVRGKPWTVLAEHRVEVEEVEGHLVVGL